MFTRLVVIMLGLMGAAGFGQAPEIATQYEQRIGGALDELGTVIGQFDADVAKNDLTRDAALKTYRKSAEPFLQDRGRSMEIAIQRFEDLTRQARTFEEAGDLMKPIHLFGGVDVSLFQGVMKDYSFGLPLTLNGLVYSVFGAIIGCLIAAALRALSVLDVRPSKIKVRRK